MSVTHGTHPGGTFGTSGLVHSTGGVPVSAGPLSRGLPLLLLVPPLLLLVPPLLLLVPPLLLLVPPLLLLVPPLLLLVPLPLLLLVPLPLLLLVPLLLPLPLPLPLLLLVLSVLASAMSPELPEQSASARGTIAVKGAKRRIHLLNEFFIGPPESLKVLTRNAHYLQIAIPGNLPRPPSIRNGKFIASTNHGKHRR
jgi:hypothetical protein